MHILHRCRFTSIAILVFICIVSSASNSYSNEGVKGCEAMGFFAEVTMKARQYGVPKSTMLSIIKDEERKGKIDKKFIGIFDATIIDAYSFPVLDNEKDKQKAILEFKNTMQRMCLTEWAQ